MIIIDSLILTKKINNFLLDATATWDSTTAHSFVVPAAKRWILLGGTQNRAVSSTLFVSVYSVGDELIQSIAEFGAATGTDGWPQGQQVFGTSLVVLDAGEYIKMTFGTAQNASSYISCVVLEVDI